MIIIGSDHAGIELKEKIKEFLIKSKINYLDINEKYKDPGEDYPDIAYLICKEVLKDSASQGIAICGTGIGISISCNKIKGIRAALCTDTYMAEMSRKHNNANVLCLGARLESSKNTDNIIRIVDTFLDSFFEGGRHDRRVNKITNLETYRMEGDI